MSEVKVNKISPRSGTTVTLGDSGDTFTIPSGATINNQGTATNFGATGSASWNTTVKTSTFTAVAGEGYFVNTTGGVVTVNLPAGVAGAVVAVKDYANTWDTNKCTLSPNGSDKVGGIAQNVDLDTEGLAVTLVFIDSTQGWLVTDSGLQSDAPIPAFITATGGTITTVCTNYKVHTFTGPGTFQVTGVGNSSGSNTVSYVVVAGGGGGGAEEGGGGGAGGFRESKASSDSYTASPLNAASGQPGYNLPVSIASYPIGVGGGGAGQTAAPGAAVNGVNSTFSTITATGGGRGGGQCTPTQTGAPGGSGGGGHGDGGGSAKAAGSGNTPPVSPPQGKDGGAGIGRNASDNEAGGGGGGATAAGTGGSNSPNPGGGGGNGGAGATTSISGSAVARAGGGGGAATNPSGTIGSGGTGGGGDGTKSQPSTAEAGTVNTGGGGGGGGGNGGAGPASKGGQGGSGIVIIRYKFQ